MKDWVTLICFKLKETTWKTDLDDFVDEFDSRRDKRRIKLCWGDDDIKFERSLCRDLCQVRLRGGGATGAIAPGPSWWKVFVSNKILVWKMFVIQKRYKNVTLYTYVALSTMGPQQQLISLQLWLSASFSNRYWITYEYFRFCSMQIYLISLVTFFLIIVLLAWVWVSTHASPLLHKCHEKVTICVLTLVVADWCLVSINVATGISLVNIRLLPSSTSDNIKFLCYGFIWAKCFY